jgi:3-oxoacyl-[acyl-carrier protein] reductase
MNQITNLKDLVIVLTGAGHMPGIGSQTALNLLTLGSRVVVNSRTFDIEWNKLQIAYPDHLLLVLGDITDILIQSQLISSAINKWGRIDGLVNNASTGPATYDNQGLLTRDSWNDNFLVNVVAVYELCLKAKAYIKEGSIVNISSRAALKPGVGNNLAYGVSKAALIRLGNQLAVDFAPDVTVNTVCPGFTESQRIKNIFGDKYLELEECWRNNSPMKQVINPSTVASTIIHLLSNKMITGQTISVCGGAST